MSSSALTSTGGGVGWQVDLPGLSSLLLNLGAAGLKRFAEAGVDFHTILCFGEIAEVCPASIEYRKQLSTCRREQRKESQWFYKIIEIGSATNFVADELLKKRAGENVVALMSSVLPVMPESTCDILLLKLFEACSATLDKTPGIGQLRCLRETLGPLAKKADFKDKTFQYHILAKRLLEEEGIDTEISTSTALPNEETAVQVILLLAKLIQENTGSIFEYRGLKGAGWVIAYARHILGLPVCVLKSSSSAVPISGDYNNSKIFVYVFDDADTCQIVNQGDVRDLFRIQSLDTDESNSWAVDVTETNVLDVYIPQSDPMRKVASLIAYSMVYDFTHLIAKSSEYNPAETDVSEWGLTPYAQYCLPAIRNRARRILELFGFDPVDTIADQPSEHWSSFFESGYRGKSFFESVSGGRNDEKEAQHAGVGASDSGIHLVAGPTWLQYNLARTVNCGVYQPAACGTCHESILTEKAVTHVRVLMRIAEAASYLAYTDWEQSLRLLSVSLVEHLDKNDTGDFFDIFEHFLESGSQKLLDNRPVVYSGTFYGRVTVLVTGEWSTWERKQDFDNSNLLAFCHRNIVFKSGVALEQSLDMEASMLQFLPGIILVNGERHNQILAPLGGCNETRIYTTPSSIEKQNLKPENHFPSLSVSTRIRQVAQGIVLEQHAVVSNKVVPIFQKASGPLSMLYVTEPCGHSYYEPLYISTNEASATLYPTKSQAGGTPLLYRVVTDDKVDARSRLLSSRFITQQGLLFDGSRPTTDFTLEIWLQAVDQNPIGQWLAYQATGYGNVFTVLQRHCCLECTFEKIERMKKGKSDEDIPKIFRIVNARLEGEAME